MESKQQQKEVYNLCYLKIIIYLIYYIEQIHDSKNSQIEVDKF